MSYYDDEYSEDNGKKKLFYARGKAVQSVFGRASTGTAQVEVLFKITEEGHDLFGKHFRWYGYLSAKAVERTLDALGHCGWDGVDLGTVEAQIGTNEVNLALAEELGQNGTTYTNVVFVNRLVGLSTKNQMSQGEVQSLASELQGALLARQQKLGIRPQPGRAPSNSYSRPSRPAEPARASFGGGLRDPNPELARGGFGREPGDDDVGF